MVQGIRRSKAVNPNQRPRVIWLTVPRNHSRPLANCFLDCLGNEEEHLSHALVVGSIWIVSRRNQIQPSHIEDDQLLRKPLEMVLMYLTVLVSIDKANMPHTQPSSFLPPPFPTSSYHITYWLSSVQGPSVVGIAHRILPLQELTLFVGLCDRASCTEALPRSSRPPTSSLPSFRPPAFHPLASLPPASHTPTLTTPASHPPEPVFQGEDTLNAEVVTSSSPTHDR